MCGEHCDTLDHTTRNRGSSPHVRGALRVLALNIVSRGIIPACAGSTACHVFRRAILQDHPRMCGEHPAGIGLACWHTGSSPHVRGAPRRALALIFTQGIIPACAGSTSSERAPPASARDHPRMCGEHRVRGADHRRGEGSSPHVRGARRPQRGAFGGRGIIPACAGSTYQAVFDGDGVRDHPRMCGEHSNRVGDWFATLGSSPHVRGARRPRCRVPCERGIIPACAGSTYPMI